jgi:hypothetical protein
MAGERQEKPTSPGEKVAKGSLEWAEKTMHEAGKEMLRDASRGTRIVAKRIPGAPGLVYDGVQVFTAKPEDKMRKIFGVAGGWIGGAAGGGLGALTGPAAPVAAPVGAAVGSAFGEDIGTDIYDRNKQAIDGAVRGAGDAIHDDLDAGRQKLEDTRRWVEQRNADLRRRFGR